VCGPVRRTGPSTQESDIVSIPQPEHPCWQRLAAGALSRMKTQHLGTQLMMKRIERSSDPATAKAKEIQAFFTKWERALPAEIQQLTIL
jgi:hypothetical protein